MTSIYITPLLMMLSIIAFSPTRYYTFSSYAFIYALPGIIYCIIKYPSKILWCLVALTVISIFSGYDYHYNLYYFNERLTNFQIISSSCMWLVSYVTMKLALQDKFTRKNEIPPFVILFYVIGILLMLDALLREERSLLAGSNSGYYVLPILPAVLYYFPKHKYKIIFLTFAICFLTIKRSTVIIMILSLIWLYVCYRKKIIRLSGRKKVRAFVVVIAIFVIVLTIGSVYLSSIVNRFSSISEDGGSHRDLVYLASINIIHSFDLKQILFGCGPKYFWDCDQLVSSCHNDYLEIMISCGVFGLLIFIAIQCILVKRLVLFAKEKNYMALLWGISCICFFIWNCLGSQFAYQSGAIGICMFWAICDYELKKGKIVGGKHS